MFIYGHILCEALFLYTLALIYGNVYTLCIPLDHIIAYILLFGMGLWWHPLGVGRWFEMMMQFRDVEALVVITRNLGDTCRFWGFTPFLVYLPFVLFGLRPLFILLSPFWNMLLSLRANWYLDCIAFEISCGSPRGFDLDKLVFIKLLRLSPTCRCWIDLLGRLTSYKSKNENKELWEWIS